MTLAHTTWFQTRRTNPGKRSFQVLATVIR